MIEDQAARLRRLVEGAGEQAGVATIASSPELPELPDPPRDGPDELDDALAPPELWSGPRRIARAIAITSGKGGVGKSNIAVNLAVMIASRGHRVCVIDADLGLANADVLCNVTPRRTLDDVVHGRCRLGEAVLSAPGGFQLVAGASGVTRMADLPTDRQDDLIRRLAVLERAMDTIIIDTGAGITRNVLSFAASAHVVVVVVSPEPTSITDGYGVIKALVQREPGARVEVVVNLAKTSAEAAGVFRRLDRVSRTFLRKPLSFAGIVRDDPVVREAVRQRVPFAAYAPRSPASRDVASLAERLLMLPEFASITHGPGESASNGFFGRLARWIRRGAR